MLSRYTVTTGVSMAVVEGKRDFCPRDLVISGILFLP